MRVQVPAVAPWDEPWVRTLMITKPMFITLYDAADRGAGQVRSIYPGGQWRFIRAGLYRRGLIELVVRCLGDFGRHQFGHALDVN